MKNLVIDLDNTISFREPESGYENAIPDMEMIRQLREYKRQGFGITIFTSRNMRTFNGDVKKIQEITLPIILEWLKKNEVPFDDVFIGKPWCGNDGFYVDDRALRPDEFKKLSYPEIRQLLSMDIKS